MKGLLAFLNLTFLPKSPDFGLLLLRCATGAGLLTLHGWDKWVHFSKLAPTAPDPLHVGRQVSLGFAVFAEVVCSALLVAGFCARFAALVLTFHFSVIFFISHSGSLKTGSFTACCLACFAALLVAGPGRFSFDGSGGGGAPKPH
jgi:putative oxidoreductase